MNIRLLNSGGLTGPFSRGELCHWIQHLLVMTKNLVTYICKKKFAVIKFGQNELYYQGNRCVLLGMNSHLIDVHTIYEYSRHINENVEL